MCQDYGKNEWRRFFVRWKNCFRKRKNWESGERIFCSSYVVLCDPECKKDVKRKNTKKVGKKG
jgi:hypothetical protein